MTTMNPQPIFRPNGDGFDIAPAGVLILVACTAYGDSSETISNGMRNTPKLMDDMLGAARVGGYTEGDIRRTLLARNQPLRRVMTMAQAACDAVGPAAIRDVFIRARRTGPTTSAHCKSLMWRAI